jgi:hypothetical protein
MFGGCGEQKLDNLLVMWRWQTKNLIRLRMDEEGGAGASKKFEPICGWSQKGMRTGMTSSQHWCPCLKGVAGKSWMIHWSRGAGQSKTKSGEWMKREELGRGRSLKPLVVAHKKAQEQA